jgi:small subunit ribosomal protein S9
MATETVYWATGKRKSSVARVRLAQGGGEVVVNGRPLDTYFGRETSRMIVHQPFELTSTKDQFRADVSVEGGGVAAQAVAIRHGITRALMIANPELRSSLKKA